MDLHWNAFLAWNIPQTRIWDAALRRVFAFKDKCSGRRFLCFYIRWQPSLSNKRSQEHNVWCLQKFPDYYEEPRPKNTAEWDVTDISEEGNFAHLQMLPVSGVETLKSNLALLFNLKSTLIVKQICWGLELRFAKTKFIFTLLTRLDVWWRPDPRSRYPLTQDRACACSKKLVLLSHL